MREFICLLGKEKKYMSLLCRFPKKPHLQAMLTVTSHIQLYAHCIGRVPWPSSCWIFEIHFFHPKPLSSSASNKRVIIKHFWSIITQACTNKYPRFSEGKKTSYRFRSTKSHVIAYSECFPMANSLVLIRVITEQSKQLPSYFSLESQEVWHTNKTFTKTLKSLNYQGIVPKNCI